MQSLREHLAEYDEGYGELSDHDRHAILSAAVTLFNSEQGTIYDAVYEAKQYMANTEDVDDSQIPWK